ELCAGELDVQMFGARSVGRDIGQVDVGGGRVGQLDLGFFGSFLQALQGQHVLGQVHALVLFEFGNDVVDDSLVEVFPAEEGIAVGRQHFELLFSVQGGDFNDGNVEGSPAEVVHGNFAVPLGLLVETEGERRCRGFI